MRLLFVLLIAGTALIQTACHKPQCSPPSSDELYIVLEDSSGNNIIVQDYPNLSLELTDNTSTHPVHSANIYDGTISQRAWQFNTNQMISGYSYLLHYDSTTVDTITVIWEPRSSECGGTTFYSRSITSVTYNDSVFMNGGVHTYIK